MSFVLAFAFGGWGLGFRRVWGSDLTHFSMCASRVLGLGVELWVF